MEKFFRCHSRFPFERKSIPSFHFALEVISASMGEQEAERFQDLLKLATRTGPFVQEAFDPENTDWSFIKILVVGAGGLGCELLHCLALSGFTDIHVIDMDTIDLSNLNRQFLFRNDDIGQPKSIVAANFINKRCPWVTVTPHFGRIENESDDFYKSFDIVILGLDSIHARTWINAKYASLVEYSFDDGKMEITKATPIIDGGTEGFKGSARIINFGKTACINCTLYLFPPQRGVPMCTLENVPRVPEHCVLYIKGKTWEVEKPFGVDDKGEMVHLDGDNPEHIIWVMQKAKERQEKFKLEGNIDFAFTQGVVKNVIPAVGFTNAMVAAMCVNEALKMAVGLARNMDCFAFYDGSKAGVASSMNVMFPDPSCPVCQVQTVKLQKDWTPQQAIDFAVRSLKETVKALPGCSWPHDGEGKPLADLPADQVVEANIVADLGADVRVPLKYVESNPLSYKTKESANQPLGTTLAAAAKDNGRECGNIVRIEISGGPMLKTNVLNVLATFA